MRNRVERLRVWLLASAGFLLLVIAVFIGTARFLRHQRLTLPNRLGINVVKETDGFTYSQSVQGRTVFTLHAAKAMEHTDEKIALHDVSITLFGEKQDRNDRIYGDDFEYDRKNGVVRAMGLVHIDLQTGGVPANAAAMASGVGKAASEVTAGAEKISPSTASDIGKVLKDANKLPGASNASGAAKGQGISAAADAKVLHVTTHGLVYLEKLGVAATSEELDFESGQMKGRAIGADYNRDTGLLMLHSAVNMSGMAGKRPVEMTASTANLDNRNRQAFLTHARYVSQGQAMEAESATLHSRKDGTLERVEAAGNVTMHGNGATVVSQRSEMVLSTKSQLQHAVLTGGVQYTTSQPLRQMRGQAEAATIAFDAQGRANHAEFTGSVHVTEKTRATATAWNTRDLTAAKVEAVLVPVGGGSRSGQSQVRDVEAVGGAHLVVTNSGSGASSRGSGTTELSADDLKAHLLDSRDAKGSPRLDTVAGRGHTVLRQSRVDGREETSSGDSLNAKFRAVPSKGAAKDSAGGVAGLAGEGIEDLWSAVQMGRISMMRRVPAKSGAKAGSAHEDIARATAEKAAYDGDLDRVTLTGGIQVSNAESVLWARQVTMDRATGDARAVGAVKVNYLRESGKRGATPEEPMHVVAERAELIHATGVTTFYGKPVRMWQAGSQVQAPVIELERVQQRMTARGESAGGAPVHTVLVRPKNDKATATGKTSARLPGVMRVASGGLVYSGSLRQALFTGGVRAETEDGTIRSNEATVYLQQTTATSSEAVPSIAGSVERMEATGQVELEQPGRKATGERLVYSANDQLFVLTGEGKALPRLVDAAHGTVTGAALRFHTGDDSVVVSGETGSVTGERVRTETRMGKDATMGKGKQ